MLRESEQPGYQSDLGCTTFIVMSTGYIQDIMQMLHLQCSAGCTHPCKDSTIHSHGHPIHMWSAVTAPRPVLVNSLTQLSMHTRRVVASSFRQQKKSNHCKKGWKMKMVYP